MREIFDVIIIGLALASIMFFVTSLVCANRCVLLWERPWSWLRLMVPGGVIIIWSLKLLGLIGLQQ